jgi:hypothetical protein
MRFLACAVSALSVSALFSFPALAQAPAASEAIGVIPIAEQPGPTAELADLAQQLRSVVSERSPGVLDAAALKDRMTGQTSTATLAELDRAYAGAVATYQSGDFEGAVRTLRAVVDDLEKLPDGPDAFDQWTRAMLRLARSDQTLGRRDEASAVVDRLVRAAPAVKVDATQYPPSFAKQIEEAKAKQKLAPKRKLTIQSSGKGAKVFLDGRDVGTAPVTVSVPAGQYKVSGKLGDLRIPRFGIDLTHEDQSVTFDVALVETLRPANGGLAVPTGDRTKTLVRAGAVLGIDKLLAASLVVQGDVTYLAGAWYDVRRGMLLREGSIRLSNRQPPPGSMAALSNFLITGAPSAPVLQGPLAGDRKPIAGPTGPELKAAPGRPSRALGWSAFGSGVLSVGLAGFSVLEGMSAKSSYSDARAMLDGGSLKLGSDPARYKQLVASGDSAKSKATLGAGLAIGTAALGGVLGYLSYKQSGEIGPFRF